MTPYIKKIVELHKIHKAIEDKDCNGGGGNTPSGDITIDDVVKFIHDNAEKIEPGIFPYTTWDDIPNIDDVNADQICKDYGDDVNSADFSNIFLNVPPYIIGMKEQTERPPIDPDINN